MMENCDFLTVHFKNRHIYILSLVRIVFGDGVIRKLEFFDKKNA